MNGHFSACGILQEIGDTSFTSKNYVREYNSSLFDPGVNFLSTNRQEAPFKPNSKPVLQDANIFNTTTKDLFMNFPSQHYPFDNPKCKLRANVASCY